MPRLKNSVPKLRLHKRSGRARVLRGGSFASYPVFLRASDRGDRYPVNRYYYFGFRCAQ